MSLILRDSVECSIDGAYRVMPATDDDAKQVVSLYEAEEVISYVKSETAAAKMSELLGAIVDVNPLAYTHVRDDIQLCLIPSTPDSPDGPDHAFKLMVYLGPPADLTSVPVPV